MMTHNDKVKEVYTTELEMSEGRYHMNPVIGEELKIKVVFRIMHLLSFVSGIR
jgi:hypothetical protein